MKKSTIRIIIIVFVGLFLYFNIKVSYNKIIEKEENVLEKWSQVENVYQRRADLIPNLVNTVKGAADFEKGTLTQVMEARAKATSVSVDANNLDPQSIQKFQKAQSQLSSAISRLMVVVERYPELKANKNFLELQAQLEGTENRISIERRKFGQAVREYNIYIRKFPRNIYANLFNFERKGYFESDEDAEKVPKVKF
jgi:LemA protein